MKIKTCKLIFTLGKLNQQLISINNNLDSKMNDIYNIDNTLLKDFLICLCSDLDSLEIESEELIHKIDDEEEE